MFTFGKTQRLLTSRDYQRAFKKTRRLSQDGISLFVSQNTVSHARLGLAISKKQVKTAVKRNRIKRAARECFRLAVDLPNVDIIVTVGKSVNGLTKAQLQRILISLWKRVNTLFNS